ncbi:SHOCT domain-containing protein [Schaalia hyovaginalis]|uniref:SHOCT domain-containing protein n=1 Tax=Schaalia hyovaginalis TaxID=29316 RepID=UPI002A81A52A|nr:SHOCT domain-containing protein [Schaalia hyovaginalis]MDY4492121.1 SHOCT domain-containing protein [Schaalia hyovaginalis]
MDNVSPDISSPAEALGAHGPAGHMAGGAAEIAWIVLAAAALAAVVVLAVWAIKRFVPTAPTPLSRLDQRLAAGEIDEETYFRTRSALLNAQSAAFARTPVGTQAPAAPVAPASPVQPTAPAAPAQPFASSAPTTVLPAHEGGAAAPGESATENR